MVKRIKFELKQFTREELKAAAECNALCSCENCSAAGRLCKSDGLDRMDILSLVVQLLSEMDKQLTTPS